jgi:hypothetical protein
MTKKLLSACRPQMRNMWLAQVLEGSRPIAIVALFEIGFPSQLRSLHAGVVAHNVLRNAGVATRIPSVIVAHTTEDEM